MKVSRNCRNGKKGGKSRKHNTFRGRGGKSRKHKTFRGRVGGGRMGWDGGLFN